MIQHTLSALGGVAGFGIISICLFFGVFAGALVWSARLRKPYLDRMRALPLEDDPRPRDPEAHSHE